jgi:hypothetical protein
VLAAQQGRQRQERAAGNARAAAVLVRGHRGGVVVAVGHSADRRHRGGRHARRRGVRSAGGSRCGCHQPAHGDGRGYPTQVGAQDGRQVAAALVGGLLHPAPPRYGRRQQHHPHRAAVHAAEARALLARRHDARAAAPGRARRGRRGHLPCPHHSHSGGGGRDAVPPRETPRACPCVSHRQSKRKPKSECPCTACQCYQEWRLHLIWADGRIGDACA